MDTHELEIGGELRIGEVHVTVLDIEGDHVLLRVRQGGGTRLLTLRAPQESETGVAPEICPLV